MLSYNIVPDKLILIDFISYFVILLGIIIFINIYQLQNKIDFRIKSKFKKTGQ